MFSNIYWANLWLFFFFRKNPNFLKLNSEPSIAFFYESKDSSFFPFEEFFPFSFLHCSELNVRKKWSTCERRKFFEKRKLRNERIKRGKIIVMVDINREINSQSVGWGGGDEGKGGGNGGGGERLRLFFHSAHCKTESDIYASKKRNK